MAQGQVLLLLLCLLLPLLLLLIASTWRRRSGSRGTRSSRAAAGHGGRLPPSPPGELPILGHLHLVSSSHPNVSLRDLAEAHSIDGLLLLRLGQVPNLVVSSPHAAEAVLRVHDHVFASRPPSAVSRILHSGASDVAMAPYGDYWRQARKLVTTHLLSARKVHSLRRAREEEVRLLLARLRDASGAAVDVTELLGASVNDVVCRAVSGKFFRAEGRHKAFRKLLDGNAALLSGFNLDDYFPSLANVDVLARVVCARITTLKKRWDGLLDEIIDEHAAKSSSSSSIPSEKEEEEDDDRDFIDVVLSLQHDYGFTRDQIKAILMDMFAAGTDTSSVLVEYAMVELMRNPVVMSRLQGEISSNTPKEQEMVREENLSNMPYLRAVIKETLRLHPPVPLLLPRVSMETCEVNGYTIPAGTRVIINAWALGRDPKSWEKADEFMPERFIVMDNGNGNGDGSSSTGATASADHLKGRDFRLLPFGAGRRMCPGINFGMATVEIMLANLVYCFDWELPAGKNKEGIDMTDVFGLTICRKEKLLLVPRPRLCI